MNKGPLKLAGMTKAGSLLVLLFALCLKSNAQFDPMFTQYMNNEMFINPAYTGTRQVTVATLLYRDQWAGIKGSPKTQTFSIHGPVSENNGIGFSIMHESIGIYNIIRANANYSYMIKTGKRSQIAFGLMGGLMQYNQNLDELVLINPNDNLYLTDNINVIAPNAGFGLFYYTDEFYLGFLYFLGYLLFRLSSSRSTRPSSCTASAALCALAELALATASWASTCACSAIQRARW